MLLFNSGALFLVERTIYILQEIRSIVKPVMAFWREESIHPRYEGNRAFWLFPVMPADSMPGPEQGHWTYKDYAALPDEWHQNTAFEIASYLRTHVKLTGLGQVYIAPFDVELNPRTVVQPDVIVVLNHNLDRITESRIIGAPDLVVEVSSPGTVGYDREKKQRNYAHAGVPEYWIADPWSRTVEVLSLVAGGYRSRGVFEGKAVLPSEIVPDFLVHVEQFFA